MLQTMEKRALEAVAAAAQARARVQEAQKSLNTMGEEMMRSLGRADEGVSCLVVLSGEKNLEDYCEKNPEFKKALSEAQHGRLVATKPDKKEK